MCALSFSDYELLLWTNQRKKRILTEEEEFLLLPCTTVKIPLRAVERSRKWENEFLIF